MNVSIKASFEFEQTIPPSGMMIDIMWIASKRNLYDLANFESDSIRKDRWIDTGFLQGQMLSESSRRFSSVKYKDFEEYCKIGDDFAVKTWTSF